MSTTYRRSAAVLYRTSDDTRVANARVSNVTCSADGGWTAKAVCWDPLSLYVGRFTTFYIVLDDGTDTLETPPLVWTPRSRVTHASTQNPGLVDMTFVDEATFRMRKNNQSFESYRGVDSSAVVAALAARAGVTINGFPSLHWSAEEIKNERLSSAFARALEMAVYDSRVLSDGTIQCTAWEADLGDLVFTPATTVHNVDPTQIYTGVRGGKQTPIPANEQAYEFTSEGIHSNNTLTEPLKNPAVAEWIRNGTLGYVDFYNASDLRVAYYSYHPDYDQSAPGFPPATTGTGPATYFNIVLRPAEGIFALDAYKQRIIVVGVTEDDLPDGVDAEFLHPLPAGDPDTSLGVWPAESDKIDSLWPSEAYFIARRQYLLDKMNSDKDTLTMTGSFRCGPGVAPLLRVSYTGDVDEVAREYKSWSISWDPEQTQTTIVCRRFASEVFADD